MLVREKNEKVIINEAIWQHNGVQEVQDNIILNRSWSTKMWFWISTNDKSYGKMVIQSWRHIISQLAHEASSLTCPL